jgi:multiple sugar transport system permease protein
LSQVRRGIHLSQAAGTRRKQRPTLGRVLTRIVLALATAWALFPVYWAVLTSLKLPNMQYALAFIPWLQFQPTLVEWKSQLVDQGTALYQSVFNSLVIALGSMAIALTLGTMAAYGLARFRYRRWKNRNITMWFLSQRFLPPVATLVPFFLVMKTLNLLDTQLALILANATFTLPFAVLLMRDAFKMLPDELEESALVDGASRFRAFRSIALPLAAPSLVATGIICFAFAWNEFLFGLVLSYQNARPITVYIAGSEATQGIAFWFVATRALVAITPPMILSLLVQRYIVRGLTLGAVKG